MKKLLVFFFLTLSFAVKSQTTNSALSSGNWYKFAVDTTGVYKIDAAFLQKIGINISKINPKNIKIYGNGGTMLPEVIAKFRHSSLQENAIFVAGEEDNRFDSNDYILFYAKGPHDWITNTSTQTAIHRQNIYESRSYYFINVEGARGKRINEITSPTGNTTRTITSYDDFVFYEKEDINLFALGRDWFGEDLTLEKSKEFKIPFANAVANTPLSVSISAVAYSSKETSLTALTNGKKLNPFKFSRSIRPSNLASKINQSTTVNPSGDHLTVLLNYNNNGDPSSKAYLDYVEIVGKKQLIVTDKQFSFRSFAQANTTGTVEFQLQNAKNIFQLWDVTDPTNVSAIPNKETTNFSFKANGGSLREYAVVNESNFYYPTRLSTSPIANQNLHNLKNIDYILITSSAYKSQAQRIADYHSKNSNLTTKVIDLEQIYNEFASGSADIVAIRDFIKHVYDNSSNNKKLKYVCFLGDSSYDYKNRITNNNNIVPTYHAKKSFSLTNSYVTDDFYVMIDDTDGGMLTSNSIDIASGRIPVSTVQEANRVVDKILNYYSPKTFGDWRNRIVFVADDIDQQADKDLQRDLDSVAKNVNIHKPALNIIKLYADSYKQRVTSGGERYPEITNGINNELEKGALVFDYFGHGGEDGLGDERYLEIPQIKAFNNKNALPLFITVTCEFSRFDNARRVSAGELLFKNPHGGAVSMITTTRDVYISFGADFNQILAKHVFDYNGTNNNTISKNLISAKNETSNPQKYFIFYFGDPAMKLAIPRPNVRITKVNNINISQPTDTLKALSKIKLEGIVADENDVQLTNFNGTVFTTIYDKKTKKQTLGNDFPVEGISGTIINKFDIQESKIFRGKSSVTNGNFNFEFIVPKDIKIAYGKAKISMYASNQLVDKGGANFDIIIGGINKNAAEDTTGPEIQLFMNDESFIDGANTNTSPNLIVKLSDISGINTSLTAVDHDITAILDGNEADAFILNDYYETELNDFTKGLAKFKLRNLEAGPHTIKVKAWDTYNNSSETTLNFTVVSDTELVLNNVLNYPNPFVNHTEFWFNHNKPNEPLEVQVQIFSVSGKLIKTLNQLVQTNGGLSRSITWNGLDDFGNKIGKGVYIYKLKVKSTVSNLVSEKYEKLVIL